MDSIKSVRIAAYAQWGMTLLSVYIAKHLLSTDYSGC